MIPSPGIAVDPVDAPLGEAFEDEVADELGHVNPFRFWRARAAAAAPSPADGGNRPAAPVELEEQAARLRLVVEGTVCGEVARDGLEEVALALAVERLVRLLGVVAVPREVAIEHARRDLLAVDRLGRRAS